MLKTFYANSGINVPLVAVCNVPPAEEPLPEQGLQREYSEQDSEHQQAICETDSERQGSEER